MVVWPMTHVLGGERCSYHFHY